MKHETSRELYGYWNRLRRGCPAPERAEIDPAGLKGILGDVFILEPSGAAYAFRLAGTRLCIAYGGELRGRDIDGFWAPQDREAIGNLLLAITEDGAGAVVGYRAADAEGRSVPFELLLLPMRHQGRMDGRVLGSAAPFEDPHWLGSTPLTSHALMSLRLLFPNERPRRIGAPDAWPFRPAPPRRRIRHLTLYDGGRG